MYSQDWAHVYKMYVEFLWRWQQQIQLVCTDNSNGTSYICYIIDVIVRNDKHLLKVFLAKQGMVFEFFFLENILKLYSEVCLYVKGIYVLLSDDYTQICPHNIEKDIRKWKRAPILRCSVTWFSQLNHGEK